jgi:hypothetical protein
MLCELIFQAKGRITLRRMKVKPLPSGKRYRERQNKEMLSNSIEKLGYKQASLTYIARGEPIQE